MNALDILLAKELPETPTKEYKLKRLSKELGEPVIFKIKALRYDDVADIQKRNGDDISVHIVLEGTVSPNLKSAELKEKYKAATPVEMVKSMLYAGEIEDLSRAIERLSGYRTNTLEEIRKNSETATETRS